jgi:serine/threonine protein kinase
VSSPPQAQCPECGPDTPQPSDGGLRCPTHDLYLIAPSEAAHRDEHPLLGQVLDGKYALTSVVGAGGFGAVYGGLQLPLNRPVAVKVLLGTSFTKKVVRDRFEREALSLARLRSEHTVRLLDFGVCRDTTPATRNLPYLVMELIDGKPLNLFHADSPLSLAQMADLVDDVAESLAEAHANGIVHRDLKPSNVLMTRDFQGRALAKVIDFGIARVEDATRSESGLISGTPRYMAPEQARSLSDLDGRVDVYALGIMLFELIAGRPPFVHALPMVVLQMQVGDPVPSFASLGVAPGLGVVEEVVRRALAKAPEARWETPLALAAAFRSAITAPDSQTLAPLPAPAPANSPEPSAPGRSRLVLGLLATATATGATFLALRPPASVPATDAAAVPTVVASSSPAPPPPSSAPTAPAPASSAVASQPATVKIEAAPSRPRPAPSRAPVPTEAARDLARAADTALLSCRCAGAEAALRSLAEAPGGAALVPPLRARLATCRNIDPDHRCVAGRLEAVE